MASSFGFNFSDTYSQLPKEFVKKAELYSFKNPQHQMFNSSLAHSLGLDEKAIKESNYIFANGNNLPHGSSSIAQAYCGHQFGHFVKLGDGRALLLGEHVTPDQKRYDIQLKGSGPTEFSRGGDGFAALGPMLREYLISESIHALGIPTTRSLSVITTGQPVFRETTLKGAILTRVAQSHIRVGTFQFANLNGKDHVRALAEYTIDRHFPDLKNQGDKFEALLLRVIDLQSQLIAQWMSVGFIHGVMNTDNMSICGETIDYGPCAFLNHYKQDTVFSSIDRNGRYAYGNQPMIAHWNLARFAESLLILFDEDIDIAKEKALSMLSLFKEKYMGYWLDIMAKKIGIEDSSKIDEKFIYNNTIQLCKKYKIKNVGIYYPINFELNIINIANKIKKQNYKVSLPVVGGKNKMSFRQWNDDEPLYINRFGILEPDSKNKIIKPNLILAPLLSFDKNKNRLGYGRGFYDRFLNSRSNTCSIITIGIAFSFQDIASHFQF